MRATEGGAVAGVGGREGGTILEGGETDAAASGHVEVVLQRLYNESAVHRCLQMASGQAVIH